MKWREKPVIVIGHGVRASGADPAPLLELGVPVLSSWQAADLVDNYHPMYFGRPGIYGQRCANRILYEADQVVSIGCRLTPWLIGHGGLRPDQELVLCEADGYEAARFPQAKWVAGDAKEFIDGLSAPDIYESIHAQRTWWRHSCATWRLENPWVESPAHDDTPGYINSYRFIDRLEPMLRPDEVIITDIGAHMCPVFQALHIRPPQRLLTSGGLGEMGCALPAAIGAAYAGAKHVLALVGDGGMMINLQELQTIERAQLPVKIIVFANDGYAMIKGTHRNMGIPYVGVDDASGVSMPRFREVADAFGIVSLSVRSWRGFDTYMSHFLAVDGPALMEVYIDPEQAYVPRLQPKRNADGTFSPAQFSELSP